MIEAKIVADSLAPSGVRLTTFVLTYPRFIHAEFMTHRMFSRNASSSRAIPVKKQIEMVIENPAIPIAFTKNQPGMQGGEALSGKAHELAVKSWLHARDRAVEWANELSKLEVHKQYANRLLEPFAHITAVCTATDFNNFFALRVHPAAQPEICELATKMYDLYSTSTPTKLQLGMWHLPFITVEENQGYLKKVIYNPDAHAQLSQDLVKKSVARCARVSYLNHEGKNPTAEEDYKLYDRLLGNRPIHASPAEHQAMAHDNEKFRSGNLRGWVQYRKTLENENITEFKKEQ